MWLHLLHNHNNCIKCNWNIFVGGGKKYCMFNIKHKIIIIPVTKLENGAQKPKHVVSDTYKVFINYYENVCIQGVIF